MIETIILYVSCVFMAWIPGENNTNYEFFQSGIMTDATVEETTWMCQEDVTVDFYVDNPMWVVGLDDEGNRSVNSNTVIARWEWNFDADNDGRIGFGDYFLFAQVFGDTAPPDNGWNFDADGNGIIGFGDYFLFAQAFGKCNNDVKEVECGL